MRFSSLIERIDISGIRKMFESASSDAINLGLGEPDFDTPEYIKRAAKDAIEKGFTKYTHNVGIPELREAISEKFKKENGIEYSPEEIIITSGASEGLYIALRSLLDPEDEVLVPDPGFVSYSNLTIICGGRPVGVPLEEDLTLSPERVSEFITEKTKAIVLNSPSNPTGAVQSRESIKGIAEIAEDHDITIISDEVYEYFIYEGEHCSPARYTDNCITVNATSKSYAMTGWRLGYLGAPKEYVNQMIKVHQYVQACASSISQHAALAAITGPKDFVKMMVEEFRRRRDFIYTALRDLGLEVEKPRGAFYIFPKVGDGVEFTKKLIKHNIITVPGSAFGKNADDRARISYATSMDNLRRAIEIMKKII
jgi:aspartate aminotransferase